MKYDISCVFLACIRPSLSTEGKFKNRTCSRFNTFVFRLYLAKVNDSFTRASKFASLYFSIRVCISLLLSLSLSLSLSLCFVVSLWLRGIFMSEIERPRKPNSLHRQTRGKVSQEQVGTQTNCDRSNFCYFSQVFFQL